MFLLVEVLIVSRPVFLGMGLSFSVLFCAFFFLVCTFSCSSHPLSSSSSLGFTLSLLSSPPSYSLSPIHPHLQSFLLSLRLHIPCYSHTCFFLIILLLYFLFPFPGESVVPTSSCAPPVARRPLRRRGSRYALVSSRLLPFPPFSSCSFDGKETDELVDLVSRTLAFVLFA